MTWTRLNDVIGGNTSFLISSHVNPDGDCIGSQLAFAWYLESLHKETVIFNRDAVPRKLRFLDGSGRISNERPARAFDVLIVLDSSNPDRLGWSGYETAAPVIVNIDHHEDNAAFAALNIVDTHSAATGQILYRFFTDTGVAYPPPVAQALYTAIMTDTGGFRFSNTNGAVLRACADLADKGADCAEAYRRLYASDSPAGLLLKSRIWSTATFYFGGKICSMEMPMSLIDEIGADYGDSEGMADYTIAADGVEAGMLIKYNDKESHFSLRSAGAVDVGQIARTITGGGGHTNAAGCTIGRPIEQARALMLDILGKELANARTRHSVRR